MRSWDETSFTMQAQARNAPQVMSQGQAIDIMTFNPYGLQYYSFRNGKIGFARTVPVFLDNANSHQALQYNNITVSKNDFCVTVTILQF